MAGYMANEKICYGGRVGQKKVEEGLKSKECASYRWLLPARRIGQHRLF